jgi:hypothetical protein
MTISCFSTVVCNVSLYSPTSSLQSLSRHIQLPICHLITAHILLTISHASKNLVKLHTIIYAFAKRSIICENITTDLLSTCDGSPTSPAHMADAARCLRLHNEPCGRIMEYDLEADRRTTGAFGEGADHSKHTERARSDARKCECARFRRSPTTLRFFTESEG